MAMYTNGTQIDPGQSGVLIPGRHKTGNKIIDAANRGTWANDQYTKEGRGFVSAGTDQASQYLGSGYDQSRQDVGQTPNRIADLYGGLGAGFTPDPGYQFRLQQGQEQIMNHASAAGGRGGGNTLRAMTDFNQGMASNEFGNYANRQVNMAGGADQTDMARNAYLGNAAQGYGQNAASLYSGQGAQLAGLGMQGASQNTGLYQSQINGLIPPPQQPKGPSGTQQLLGLGGMVAGYYFGGPVGGAVGGAAGQKLGGG